MKRSLLYLLMTCLLAPGMILAQQDKAPSVTSLKANLSVARQHSPQITTNALFDLQFDYALTRGGFAGIGWTHTKFWVSKWASDSLFEVDPATGALSNHFTIPGVTGVRGMAFDGKSMWVTNNTTDIFQVDTITHAVLKTLACPLAARGIAYDSSVAGGGFWIGNFDTDITLIDSSGITQNAILAGTHGLTGMYSIAFDPYSTGGPFIWAFDQGTTGAEQRLVRIPILSGVPDLFHDVNQEIGGGGTGIAGGLTITGFANPGPHTLLGVSQDSPADRIFGLELGDFVLPAFDASAGALSFEPANIKTPAFLASPITWTLGTKNEGANTLDSIACDLRVNDGTTDVFTSTGVATATPSLVSTQITMPGTFTPPTTGGNSYDVSAVLNTGSQTDLVHSNDSATSYSFSTTDSVMSRFGTQSGSIGIGDGVGGSIGIMFDIPSLAYANSATFKFVGPTEGDSTFAELWTWNGTTPDAIVDVSATHIFTAADTNGVELTFKFLNAPIHLNPGTYILAIHEHFGNITIAYSLFNWRANTCWILTSAGWQPSEGFNFNIVPFESLNLVDHGLISVNEIDNAALSVYPNPNSSQFVIDMPVPGKYKMTITDVQGKTVYNEILQGQQKEMIRTSDWSNGMYILKAEFDGKNYFGKMTVVH